MVYSLEEIAERILPVVKKYNIFAVYLFGSYARGTATSESDIDLLIDTTGMTIHGMQYGELYCDFEDALGKSIDMITMKSLQSGIKDAFADTVESEKVQLYAAA